MAENSYPPIPPHWRKYLGDMRWRCEQSGELSTGWQLVVDHKIPLPHFQLEGLHRIEHKATGVSFKRVR